MIRGALPLRGAEQFRMPLFNANVHTAFANVAEHQLNAGDILGAALIIGATLGAMYLITRTINKHPDLF